MIKVGDILKLEEANEKAIAILLLFMPSLVSAQEFNFHGSLETSIIANDARMNGGNEFSVGDYFAHVGLDVKINDILSTEIQYIPENLVVNTNDPEKRNFHNEHWLRADGYTNTPSLLAKLNVDWKNYSLQFGTLKVTGLDKLCPIQHYLSEPAPIVHATHYDKGVRLGADFDWIRFSTSIIDGDWTFGETSVIKMSNSAANSYPSYGASLTFDFDYLYFGANGTYGQLGSHPGEKRRQNNLIGFLGFRYDSMNIRAFATYMARNPKDKNDGLHHPAIETKGFGIETRNTFYNFTLYSSIWYMESNGEDGEIWHQNCTKIIGMSAGLRYDFSAFYIAAQYQYLMLNDSLYHVDKNESVIFLSLGIDF